MESTISNLTSSFQREGVRKALNPLCGILSFQGSVLDRDDLVHILLNGGNQAPPCSAVYVFDGITRVEAYRAFREKNGLKGEDDLFWIVKLYEAEFMRWFFH